MERAETQKVIKRVLLVVALVAVVLLVATSQDTLRKTWDLLLSVKLHYLVLLPVLKVASYFFLGNYYRSLLKALGHHLKVFRSFELVIALEFVNQILPSGGMSGISYLAYGLRNVSPVGTTSLVQVGRYVLAFASYAVVLVGAAVALLISHNVNTAVTIVLIGMLVAATIAAMLIKMVLMNRRRFDRFVQAVLGFVNRGLSWLRRQPTMVLAAKALQEVLDDFHGRIDMIRSQRGQLAGPFSFMLLSTLCEMAIVNVAFLAIGVTVHPAVIVLGFAAANVVGTISVIPGDVGVHEAAMIFVLTAFGVSGAAALSATLLYRVFNKMLFLPIGFYFYSRFLKPVQTAHG